MNQLDRITIGPDICNGKPVVRGLRITVESILDYLSAGETPDEILRQHPMLEPEDIPACLAFADERIERDAKSGKLDELMAEARANHRAGLREEL